MRDRSQCITYYWDEFSSTPSTKAVLCTIAILILTVALEVIAHFTFKDKTAEAQATPDPTTNRYATTHTRATRLALAFILYPLILTVFILRILEANSGRVISKECQKYISGTDWVAIFFLNIIPFACASTSFLRALVDCILVRFNSGLRDNFSNLRDEEGKPPWFPCMPLFAAFCLVYVAFECLKVPIALMMGKKDISKFTSNRNSPGNVRLNEMRSQGEEARGLVEGMENGEENENTDDAKGLPAYEEVFRPIDAGGVQGKGGDVV